MKFIHKITGNLLCWRHRVLIKEGPLSNILKCDICANTFEIGLWDYYP